MLGHRSLKTTQIYAKVLDSKIAEEMSVLKAQLEQEEAQKGKEEVPIQDWFCIVSKDTICDLKTSSVKILPITISSKSYDKAS